MTDLDPTTTHTTPTDLDPTDPQTPDQLASEVESTAERAGINRAARRRVARAGRRKTRRAYRHTARVATGRSRSPQAGHPVGLSALAPQVLVVDEAQLLLAATGAQGQDITDAVAALVAAGRRPGVLVTGGGETDPGEQVARTADVARELLAQADARGRALTRSLRSNAGIPQSSGKTATVRRLVDQAALADADVWVGGAR
jgi:hypothetical protein